ncbi:MAG: hypothetical protein A6F71_09785 [Cycloclasticus sp. symbiont of Poecilosclerida sp. M]|nr:MAG: hypothetical protein A6F71_09785 [Cycloclasticus sp. symbiont of Poecilosclerida sp. M]
MLLRNGLIQVRVNATGTGGAGAVLDSSKQLQAGVRQYILIELRSVVARGTSLYNPSRTRLPIKNFFFFGGGALKS